MRGNADSKFGKEYDDVASNVSINFPIQVYEERAQNFTVTTNGVSFPTLHQYFTKTSCPQLFAVGVADIADDIANTALYASALPPGTVCVFWKDLVAGPTAQQGIYYQIDVQGVNSQLSVEYILTSFVDPTNATSSPTQLYHVILVYGSDAIGLVELFYFSDGDGGASATIGAQGFDTNQNPQAAQYVYNTTVAAGDLVNLATDLTDNPNGTAILKSFAVGCYGPGTFPVGTCH